MLNLVILGDSIAKGYGSSKELEGGFGTILGEKLSADVTNLGIVGLDSDQLLEKLSEDKFIEAVEEADVICLSIGSNDLLKPFLAKFAGSLGVKGEEKELFGKIQDKMSSTASKNPLKAADMLSSAMKLLTNNEELNKACEQFPSKYEKIITRLHEINPDVIIYANNIYNPYFGVAYEYSGISIFNVQQLCEPYINKLNKTFVQSDEYEYIDVYSIFRQRGYTNVNAGSFDNMSEINLDPHPNDAGYKLMADYIYTRFDSIVPEVTSAQFDISAYKENKAEIKISFSESVRLVKGKSLQLRSEDEKECFIYEIKDNFWIEADEETYTLSLNFSDFMPQKDNKTKQLEQGKTYTLYADDGAIKDKNNNHLKNEQILQFTLPKENKNTTLTTSSDNIITVLSDGKNIGIILTVVIFAVIIISSVIVVFKRRNKKQ